MGHQISVKSSRLLKHIMGNKWTPPLTLNQQIAIAIMPKITASFSIIGSLLILQHIIRSPKRRAICYHRLLLGLSSMDVISSIKSFCVRHTVLI